MMTPARHTLAKLRRYPMPICLVSSRPMRLNGMGLNAAIR